MPGSPVGSCAERGGEPSASPEAPTLSWLGPPTHPSQVLQVAPGNPSQERPPGSRYPAKGPKATRFAWPLPASRCHPLPGPRNLSLLPTVQPRGPGQALCVTREWKAMCFHQTLLLSPLSTPLAPGPESAFCWTRHHRSLARLLPRPLSHPTPPPAARLSLNFSFFLPRTGNCETVRESPGGFGSKRSSAVLRRAQRAAVNVTLSPSSCTCRLPRPLRFTGGSPGARGFSDGRESYYVFSSQ